MENEQKTKQLAVVIVAHASDFCVQRVDFAVQRDGFRAELERLDAIARRAAQKHHRNTREKEMTCVWPSVSASFRPQKVPFRVTVGDAIEHHSG